jgi:hypothetical protein
VACVSRHAPILVLVRRRGSWRRRPSRFCAAVVKESNGAINEARLFTEELCSFPALCSLAGPSKIPRRRYRPDRTPRTGSVLAVVNQPLRHPWTDRQPGTTGVNVRRCVIVEPQGGLRLTEISCRSAHQGALTGGDLTTVSALGPQSADQ